MQTTNLSLLRELRTQEKALKAHHNHLAGNMIAKTTLGTQEIGVDVRHENIDVPACAFLRSRKSRDKRAVSTATRDPKPPSINPKNAAKPVPRKS